MLHGMLTLLAATALGGVPQEPAREYEVKAAFLLNFARFVEWPTEAFENGESPLVVGVLGRDPFGQALERTFKDQKIGGRGFEIRRFSRIDEIESCQILFIADSERARLKDLLHALDQRAILAVSDSTGFAESGGVIGFTTGDRKIRFEVNTAAAERAGIKLSSKLLKLARVVKGRRDGP